MRYKKSEFNYIQRNGDYYLIYNTLYNSLARLCEDEFNRYNKLADSEDEFSSLMAQNGFWVDSLVDEKSKYLAFAEAYTLYAPRPLSITLTTTLKCNARCSYCYEKGVRHTDIKEGSEDKIIDFIRKHNKTNEIYLIWFGGEPLMNIPFMDSLCNHLIEEKIFFSSYIITNGSLLNKEIIEAKFRFWNIKGMQVTLDGTKEVYETIKNYRRSGEGEFYSILNNIRIAAENGVRVSLRLNIGRDNKDSILELLKELDHVFYRYDNIVFYPAFVTGEKEILSEEERVDFIRDMLLNMKNINKLTASTKFYSLPRMNACNNGNPYSFSIDVDGNIYFCEHYVGQEHHRIGDLEKGLLTDDSRGIDVVFREECRNCVFLPKCFGGCNANYVEGDIPCMIEKYVIQAYLQIL